MADSIRMIVSDIRDRYYDGEIGMDDEFVDAPAYDALAADKADLLRVLDVADARVKALEAELAMQKEILARYHKLNLAAPETPCNHDLQSAEKTLKAVMDGSLNGFYCTVCDKRWGFPVETGAKCKECVYDAREPNICERCGTPKSEGVEPRNANDI